MNSWGSPTTELIEPCSVIHSSVVLHLFFLHYYSGDAASPEDGTLVQLNVPESGASLGWSLSVRFQQLGMIVVDIGIPPTAHVGRWEMSVVIGGQLAYRVHKHIYVIFNPWNPGKVAFLH